MQYKGVKVDWYMISWLYSSSSENKERYEILEKGSGVIKKEGDSVRAPSLLPFSA